MKFRRLTLLIIGLLIFLPISQISAKPAKIEVISPDLDAVETYLQSQMQRHALKGMAVAITQGDEVIYLEGFGSAGRGRPVTPQTPFFIGSVSKSFTALAVMQLVDQGLIALDAPVQVYIPWFTTADNALSSQITIRHLLNQTSGMADSSLRMYNISEHITLEETVRYLSRAELTAIPGTTFNYFNPNYNVLAQVIEEVTGVDFATYLKTNVIAPLDMNNSFVELEPAQKAGVADGHSFFLGFPLTRQQPFYPSELPSGFVIASAEDMAHYMIALINGGTYQQTQPISADAIQAMHTPPQGVESDYAMGWSAYERDGFRIVRHNGAVETFYAEVLLLPDQDIGITVLVNQNALIPLLFAYGPIVDGLADTVLGVTSGRGPSLRFVYAILALVILFDIARHIFSLTRLSKWWQRVKDRSRARLVVGIILQHLLIPTVLMFVILMMIMTSGTFAARITLFYYLFDIALWLLITSIFSVVIAVRKFQWVAKQRTQQHSPA